MPAAQSGSGVRRGITVQRAHRRLRAVAGRAAKQLRKSLKVMNRETNWPSPPHNRRFATAGSLRTISIPSRCGVSFGAGYVGIRPDDFVSGVDKCRDAQGGPSLGDWGEKGLPEVHPLWLLTCLPNMPGCYIAMYNNLQGPNNTITLGDGAANLALLEAADLIRDGDADVMLAGGCGNSARLLQPAARRPRRRPRTAGDDPAGILRPFDRDRYRHVAGRRRRGVCAGRTAVRADRGATIYGEVLGGGASCVVERGVPNRSAAMAMRCHCAPHCLAEFAAGGDRPRSGARVLSSRRVRHRRAAGHSSGLRRRRTAVLVTAAKGHFGDAGAGLRCTGAGGRAAVAQVRPLFPVLNCDHPDPDCRLNLVRDGDAAAGESFLKLSVTPQGQASVALIVRAAA